MKLKALLSAVLLFVTLFGLSAALPAQAAPVCTQYYTVQRGDNLYRISLRFGVSMAAVQSWNGITNANRIYAGQTLCVQQIDVPRTYTVQRGDWLSLIARRFGVNATVLARVNNLSNPSLIYPGQVLTIPDVTIQ